MSTRHLAFRMSVRSGEPASSPNVRLNPVSRGPRHCAPDGAVMFGVPKALSVCFRNVPPTPCEKNATDSGPCWALIVCRRSAM